MLYRELNIFAHLKFRDFEVVENIFHGLKFNFVGSLHSMCHKDSYFCVVYSSS